MPTTPPPIPKLSAEELRNLRRQYLVVTLLFLSGVSCFVYLLIRAWRTSRPIGHGDLACVTHESFVAPDKRMSGISGLPVSGQVRVLLNYFACNPVHRGDLAYLKIADHIPPVIRVVRGVPGDHYEVYQVPGKKDRWQVKINGRDVETAGGPMVLVSKFDPALRTYQVSRHGILRNDEYILFSNSSPSLEDSSDLGLISKDRLIGLAQ